MLIYKLTTNRGEDRKTSLHRRAMLTEPTYLRPAPLNRGNTLTRDLRSFAFDDLSTLRDELRQNGLDMWQAGELISAFLVGRGYGVSNDEARTAASRLESVGCDLQSMQEELSRLALVM